MEIRIFLILSMVSIALCKCNKDRRLCKNLNNGKMCSDSTVSFNCSSKVPSECMTKQQFGSKSGEFNPNEAFDATLYSALAYSDEPVKCANKILKDGQIEIVEVIGRKCDFHFDYRECFAITAVSHSLKHIILAYRGTSSVVQLIEEILSVLRYPKVHTEFGGNVEQYFSNANDQLYPCAKSSLKDLVMKFPTYRVIVTGHSLGGAIASIASAQLVFDNVIDKDMITLYTFGMPRTGDCEYAVNHDKLVRKSWRIVHFKDLVSQLPEMTKGSNSPFHHNREIFYGKNMTIDSDYIECLKYEDQQCSDGLGLPLSIDDHLMYYGIKVGSYCDDKLHQQNKRSGAGSAMSHLFDNDACKRVAYNGTNGNFASVNEQ